MSTISTNECKNGIKVMVDGEPCSILANEYVKPGKGQAFNRIKLRKLKTGRVVEKTFKSGSSLTIADVLDLELQYLYNDGEMWHFMSSTTYEQYTISKNIIDNDSKWLKAQDTCTVTLWNNNAIAVIPPTFVTLKVIATDPGLRGDTATGGSKPATLETGAIVRVPLFINIGDTLKIDTRTGTYVARVN